MDKESICVLQFDDWIFRRHIHGKFHSRHCISTCILLCLPESGSLVMTIFGKEHTLEKGVTGVIPPFVFFDLKGSEESDATFFRIPSEVCDEVGIIDLERFSIVINDNTLTRLLLEIKVEYDEKPRYTEEYVRLTLCQVLIHLYRFYRAETPFNTGSQSFQTLLLVRNAIKYMVSHFSESISTKDSALYLYVSTSYLDRCFKTVVGSSPVTFLKAFRCKAADILLKEGYSAEQTAFACGFSGTAYFMRVYKETKKDRTPITMYGRKL